MAEPTPGLIVTGGEQEAAGVQTVFGRPGPNVTAQPGDYDASQVQVVRGQGLTVKAALDAMNESVTDVQQGEAALRALVNALQTAATVLKKATGPLSQHRVVYAADADHVAAADAGVLSHGTCVYGITQQPAEDPEQNVEIARAGEVTEPDWAFTPLAPVFLGREGRLTQVYDPTWAFVLIVGFALSPTRMLIDFKAPIFLAH